MEYGTSKKHRFFVDEPMGQKPVTALSGIGQIYGVRLARQGYYLANMLLGQFLVLQQNKELFINWFMSTTMANYGHAQACYNCLEAWCAQHL